MKQEKAGVTWEDVRAPRLDASPSRILLIQSGFLGDCALSVPLVRETKRLYPRAKLSVLTLPAFQPIFEAGGADETIPDDKRGENGGILGTLRLARRLKARGFDLALLPHRSLRSALLALLSGARSRVGFSNSAGRALLTRAVPFYWRLPDLERQLSLLKSLAPELSVPPGASVYLAPEPGALEHVSRRLARAQAGPSRLVGVHAGSVWGTKRWLKEGFTSLCRELKARGFEIILIGGPGDRGISDEIARESGALNWAGETTIPELLALLSRLSLFVTNDSGPMHLSCGLGVKTLALFGPTTRELGFFPYGPGHRVIERPLPCRPCSLHGPRRCPRGHFLCMRLITHQQVLAAALEMLGEGKNLG